MSGSGTSRADRNRFPEQIWEESRAEVGAQLAVVEQAVAAAVAGELGDQTRARAAREAHKLAGSVGTLGFAGACERARELELGLSSGVVSRADAALLEVAVRACRSELFRGVSSADPASKSGLADGSTDSDAEQLEPGALGLLLVADDDPRARQIIVEAQRRGLASALAPDVGSARRLIALRTPGIVLLDLALSEDVDASLRLLKEAASERPVLVIIDPEQSVDRVEIARRGGRGFLPQSLTAIEAVDAVISLRQRRRPAGTRVLAVDDDPVMLVAIDAALDGAGLDVRTCVDPTRFWAVLEEHQPDLLVLDFDMPGITGPELCRSLRNDERWEGLPVLFLASTSSPESIRAMFDAGADDCVPKPFVGPELLARIFSRLERVARYRALADVDSLTGALNRRKSVQDIERLLRMAARSQLPVSLGILDVDNFKAINAAHGHPTGDAVLREVAGALRRFLRGDDVVARWGGDEFVIAMYGMSGNDGHQKVGEFLKLIRRASFAEDAAVRVTMSAGLAECPTDGTNLQSLYQVADEALYTAKEQGRDRVVHHASHSADEPDTPSVKEDSAPVRRVEQALQTRGNRTVVNHPRK